MRAFPSGVPCDTERSTILAEGSGLDGEEVTTRVYQSPDGAIFVARVIGEGTNVELLTRQQAASLIFDGGQRDWNIRNPEALSVAPMECGESTAVRFPPGLGYLIARVAGEGHLSPVEWILRTVEDAIRSAPLSPVAAYEREVALRGLQSTAYELSSNHRAFRHTEFHGHQVVARWEVEGFETQILTNRSGQLIRLGHDDNGEAENFEVNEAWIERQLLHWKPLEIEVRSGVAMLKVRLRELAIVMDAIRDSVERFTDKSV